MLRSVKELRRYLLQAVDGYIGAAKDVLFDDSTWKIRYLVADTGSWLNRHEVLLSPFLLDHEISPGDELRIHCTQEQVKQSPSLESDNTVSRMFEDKYNMYYGIPSYYNPGLMGAGSYPYMFPVTMAPLSEDRTMVQDAEGDPHLRSAREVVGYSINAIDGHCGQVEDLLVDMHNWNVHGLLVDLKHWLAGRKVMIPRESVEHIDWDLQEVSVRLQKEKIKAAPDHTS